MFTAFVVVTDDVADEADVVAGKTVTFMGSAVTLLLHVAVANGKTEIWWLRDAATLVDAPAVCLEGCGCLASRVTTLSLASELVM